MTVNRSIRLPMRVALLATLGAALIVAGCGRRGPPELVSEDPAVKPASTNELVPGIGLPQRGQTQAKKPKGQFILDPLL